MPDVPQLKVFRPLDLAESVLYQALNTDDAVVYDSEEAPWLVSTLDGRPMGRVVWFEFVTGDAFEERDLPTPEHLKIIREVRADG